MYLPSSSLGQSWAQNCLSLRNSERAPNLEPNSNFGGNTLGLARTEIFSKYSSNDIHSFFHSFMSHLLPKQLGDTRPVLMASPAW